MTTPAIRTALIAMPYLHPGTPSLALACLSAALRAEGLPVEVHPFNNSFQSPELTTLGEMVRPGGRRFQELLGALGTAHCTPRTREEAVLDLMLSHCCRQVLEGRPQVVGLSVLSTNALASLLLAACIREADPQVKIILGGPECHPDLSGELLMSSRFVDGIVIGEGERSLVELIDRFASGSWEPCAGTMLRTPDGRLLRGEARPPLDMDSLPDPDLSDFEVARLQQHRNLPVAFNRGCVGGCVFCFERRYWGPYRQMSVDRAADMLQRVASRYRVDSFNLAQSLLNSDISWLQRFCDRLIADDPGVFWGGNARVHPRMDAELLATMERAGCRYLQLGLESGAERTLRAMGKGISIGEVSRVIRAVSEAGIWVHAYWILGFPGESREDLLATLDFIAGSSAYLDSCTYHVFNDRGVIRERLACPQGSASEYYQEHAQLIDSFVMLLNELCGFAVARQLDAAKRDRKTDKVVRARHLLTVLLLRHLLADSRARQRFAACGPSRSQLSAAIAAFAERQEAGVAVQIDSGVTAEQLLTWVVESE